MEKETNLKNRKSKTSIEIALASNGKSTDIHNAKDDSNSKGKTPDGTGLYNFFFNPISMTNLNYIKRSDNPQFFK
jgi:hypothetical protein